jgi:tellurite methyltransferase
MSEADRIKWDARYREEGEGARAPSAFLTSLDAPLPRAGRALDVAGGAGRNAIWLARRGLEVTLADISEVGLTRASEEAARAGVRLTTAALDLEQDAPPAGPWDVILCCYFLHRPLYPWFREALAPGGFLVVNHPTRSNLLRHEKPSAPFLLEDKELRGLVSGLELVRYDEGWQDDGRHEARLLARRL